MSSLVGKYLMRWGNLIILYYYFSMYILVFIIHTFSVLVSTIDLLPKSNFYQENGNNGLFLKTQMRFDPPLKIHVFFFLPFAYVNLLHGPKLKTLLFCTCDSHSFFFLLVLIYFFFLIEFFFSAFPFLFFLNFLFSFFFFLVLCFFFLRFIVFCVFFFVSSPSVSFLNLPLFFQYFFSSSFGIKDRKWSIN